MEVQTTFSLPGRRTLVGRRLVVVIIALLTAAGAWIVYRDHVRYRHFAVHDPGKVYRSAWVDGDVFRELIPKYKVRTVINLCYPGEMGDRIMGEREAVGAAGAKLVELPFPSNESSDIEYPAVREIESIFADPASYPIWIHCQHGRERTVKALSIYDIRQRGLSADSSLARMPLFGMSHPQPVVDFAHNYQRQFSQPNAGDGPAVHAARENSRTAQPR